MPAEVEEAVEAPTRLPRPGRPAQTWRAAARPGCTARRAPRPPPVASRIGKRVPVHSCRWASAASASSATKAEGTIGSGRRSRRKARSWAGSPSPPSETDVRDQPLVTGLDLAEWRASTTACRTLGWLPSTASISPGSTRTPRTLTWLSARPRNSTSPPGSQRARSPVRYRRAPDSEPKDRARSARAVSSADRGSRGRRPCRPCTSRPATPDGHGPEAAVQQVDLAVRERPADRHQRERRQLLLDALRGCSSQVVSIVVSVMP